MNTGTLNVTNCVRPGNQLWQPSNLKAITSIFQLASKCPSYLKVASEAYLQGYNRIF